MCQNDLHIVMDCPPAAEGQPDVCDMIGEFIQRLSAVEHTVLNVSLSQVEDSTADRALAS